MKAIEKENREKYKEILDLQIKERQEKNKAEREYIREQASLWKQEEEFYSKFNETKNQKQKQINEDYKSQLQCQINEKEQKMKKHTSANLPDENQIKEIMLDQIRTLDAQNQLLNEQLQA